VSAAAGLADTASLFAASWSATDASGRGFLADALRDACDRALKALDDQATAKAGNDD
jgi:hypothetical protein